MENIHSATTAQRKDVKVEMDEVVEGESTTPIHDVTPVNPVKDARVDSPTASPITKPKRRLKRSRRTSSIDQASSPSSRKKARTLPEKKAKRKQPARNGFPTKHYDFFPLPEHQHCKNPNPKKIHSLVRVKTGVPPWKYPIEIAIPGLRGQFREILDDEDLDEFLNEYDKGSAPENLVTENPATEHPVTEQSVKELLVLQSSSLTTSLDRPEFSSTPFTPINSPAHRMSISAILSSPIRRPTTWHCMDMPKVKIEEDQHDSRGITKLVDYSSSPDFSAISEYALRDSGISVSGGAENEIPDPRAMIEVIELRLSDDKDEKSSA